MSPKDNTTKPGNRNTPTPPSVAEETASPPPVAPAPAAEAQPADKKAAKTSKPYSLVLDSETYNRASVFARLTGTSVSAIVEAHLAEIVRTKLKAELAKLGDL